MHTPLCLDSYGGIAKRPFHGREERVIGVIIGKNPVCCLQKIRRLLEKFLSMQKILLFGRDARSLFP